MRRPARRPKQLYERIKGGEDFAKLAKEFSKDSASAQEGGDLNWSTREAMDKALGDKLFAMSEGELSEPVKTQFGYHVLRLDGIRASAGRSFEDVRAELVVALRNELAAVQFGSQQDQLQERLERGGANLDALVKEFGLRRGEVERFRTRRGRPAAGIGCRPQPRSVQRRGDRPASGRSARSSSARTA